MFNLMPLTLEARPIVRHAAAVYLRHTRPWFVGLLVHGSALKGGFIPGSSDIDLQLYLEDAAFAAHGQLPLELCLAIHRDLAGIDPAPFHYIQCLALPARRPGDLVGPIPGAYHVVAGRLPWPEATARQLRDAAFKALGELAPVPAFITSGLLEHGGGRLAADVRLLCTKVWPVLYQVLTLQHDDPLAVWGLPKRQAIELLPGNSPLRRAIEAFDRALRACYRSEEPVEQALAVIEAGVAFLQTARRWWEEHASSAGPG